MNHRSTPRSQNETLDKSSLNQADEHSSDQGSNSDWHNQITLQNEAILKSIEELIDQTLQNTPEEA